MAEVRVEHVTRDFGPHRALDDVTIAFENGGFYALLGPSGSGKTTLLRMIAGFDYPDAGRILIGGSSVERVPVERREIGMVFQNYALFPNMTVTENVGFGLRVRGQSRRAVSEAVARVLDLVQLGALADRRPRQLSGGQQQRVALARAIVTNPRVLLLDEPLSALDKALRSEMQLELKRIQREIGITTIFVTHDQEEALSMADRIGILRDGRLIQEGAPEQIYNHPVTEFAATFLGDANILRGTVDRGGIRLSDGTLIATQGSVGAEGSAAICAIRPERIEILLEGAGDAADGNIMRGVISKSIFSGTSSTYFVDCRADSLKVITQNRPGTRIKDGARVSLRWTPESTVVLQD